MSLDLDEETLATLGYAHAPDAVSLHEAGWHLADDEEPVVARRSIGAADAPQHAHPSAGDHDRRHRRNWRHRRRDAA